MALIASNGSVVWLEYCSGMSALYCVRAAADSAVDSNLGLYEAVPSGYWFALLPKNVTM